MRDFFRSKDASGIIRRLALAALFGILFVAQAVSPVIGADFSTCDAVRPEQSTGSSVSAPPVPQAPAKRPAPLRLMGGPRAEKLPPDIRSVPPETLIGTQGVTPFAGINGPE